MTEEVPDLDPGGLEAFIEEYLQLDRKVQRPDGLYSILSGPREKQYQDSLRYFLDPQKPHGFDETLLESFLECLGVHHHNLQGQHVELETEVQITDAGSDGRIDLVVCGGNALSDHPRWAVFLELKVGATEGEGQTPAYAEADRWNFSWFDSDEVVVDQLAETTYAYLKRDSADDATADSFQSVAWKAMVRTFDRQLQGSLFDYPHRSVVQLTDFIQSLKETEHMDSPFDESQLSERLNLYFEYSDLIEQVEKANSQFESDFENLSEYLQSNWVARLRESYDFEESRWLASPSSNAKWQGLLPAYWDQDPLGSNSTIQLYFRHSPTTDSLRNRTLRFRLRLPPQRHVHTTPQGDSQSFNDVFTSLATAHTDRFDDTIKPENVDEVRLGSASTLFLKAYPLDPQNLAGSYFEQLESAVEEFCVDNPELLTLLNEVFEETYRTVFEAEPVGEFPGPLHPKESEV